MTPGDVAAIRARYGNPHSGDIHDLCDALEASWSALARVRELCDDVYETRSTHPFASTVEIRNALEGDNE